MWIASAAALLGLFGCLAFWLIYRRPRQDAMTKIPVRELVTFGGWNFAVSVATALVLVVTLQMLSASGADVAEIGKFSVAVLIQGALLTPGNMLGPVIYNAWSRAPNADTRYASYASLQRLALPVAICACITVAPLLREILPVLVGDGFEGALSPTWILLLAVPFGYWLRLMANVLLAVGAAHVYAFSAIARLFSVVMVLVLSGAHGIQAAAIAWVAGEVIAVLICMLGLRYSLGWSFGMVIGIRPAVIAVNR
jgi:O-antigen/teichoic acid export membrane protein